MKAFRLLATSLLVALSMGVSSCGEDELESSPTTSIDTDNLFDKTDKLFAEYIKDYADIKCRFGQQGGSSVLFSGVKNKHLWFSEYDATTKQLKSEWTDIEETDTILNVYKGYGEYETVKLNYILPAFYKKTSTGDIVTLKLNGYNQTIFTFLCCAKIRTNSCPAYPVEPIIPTFIMEPFPLFLFASVPSVSPSPSPLCVAPPAVVDSLSASPPFPPIAPPSTLEFPRFPYLGSVQRHLGERQQQTQHRGSVDVQQSLLRDALEGGAELIAQPGGTEESWVRERAVEEETSELDPGGERETGLADVELLEHHREESGQRGGRGVGGVRRIVDGLEVAENDLEKSDAESAVVVQETQRGRVEVRKVVGWGELRSDLVQTFQENEDVVHRSYVDVEQFLELG